MKNVHLDMQYYLKKIKIKKIKLDDYPSIYICTNEYYYDTYPGIMLYNRLKKITIEIF